MKERPGIRCASVSRSLSRCMSQCGKERERAEQSRAEQRGREKVGRARERRAGELLARAATAAAAREGGRVPRSGERERERLGRHKETGHRLLPSCHASSQGKKWRMKERSLRFSSFLPIDRQTRVREGSWLVSAVCAATYRVHSDTPNTQKESC